MRLLRVDDLTFEEHFEPNVPDYAILSHRWEEDEILHADIITKKFKHKKGFKKLKYTLEQATKDRLRYIWIDTFCIDKSSSADLSEAINSMFRWYESSVICYAYLSDYEITGDAVKQFTSSAWFTRGWTLQELIAPKILWFLDRYWQTIGQRENLTQEITNRTKIPRDLFRGTIYKGKTLSERLSFYPACRKFSWAAGRKTTRVEDRAYSLLGLFGVNMPLLYGEGHRAFERLQEEIFRVHNDLSVLAWNFDANTKLSSRLLAESPDLYYDCSEMVFSRRYEQQLYEDTVISLTNIGLRIDSPQLLEIVEGKKVRFFLNLACYPHGQETKAIVLKLERVAPPQTEERALKSQKTLSADGRMVIADFNELNYRPATISRTKVVEFLDCSVLKAWPTLIIDRRRGGNLSREQHEPHTHVGIANHTSRAWTVIEVFPHEHWNCEETTLKFPDHTADPRWIDKSNVGAIALRFPSGSCIAITFIRNFLLLPRKLMYDVRTYDAADFGGSDALLSTGNHAAELPAQAETWDRCRHDMLILEGHLHVDFKEATRSTGKVVQLSVTVSEDVSDIVSDIASDEDLVEDSV